MRPAVQKLSPVSSVEELAHQFSVPSTPNLYYSAVLRISSGRNSDVKTNVSGLFFFP